MYGRRSENLLLAMISTRKSCDYPHILAIILWFIAAKYLLSIIHSITIHSCQSSGWMTKNTEFWNVFQSDESQIGKIGIVHLFICFPSSVTTANRHQKKKKTYCVNSKRTSLIFSSFATLSNLKSQANYYRENKQWKLLYLFVSLKLPLNFRTVFFFPSSFTSDRPLLSICLVTYEPPKVRHRYSWQMNKITRLHSIIIV